MFDDEDKKDINSEEEVSDGSNDAQSNEEQAYEPASFEEMSAEDTGNNAVESEEHHKEGDKTVTKSEP